MSTEKQQKRLEDELEKETVDEVLHEGKHPEHGKAYGIGSIALALISLVLPFPFHYLGAIIAATLAVAANHHGKRALAIVGALLSLIVLLWFFIIAGRVIPGTGGQFW